MIVRLQNIKGERITKSHSKDKTLSITYIYMYRTYLEVIRGLLHHRTHSRVRSFLNQEASRPLVKISASW